MVQCTFTAHRSATCECHRSSMMTIIKGWPLSQLMCPLKCHHWPWVPSIDQDLKPFIGNWDVSMWKTLNKTDTIKLWLLLIHDAMLLNVIWIEEILKKKSPMTISASFLPLVCLYWLQNLFTHEEHLYCAKFSAKPTTHIYRIFFNSNHRNEYVSEGS